MIEFDHVSKVYPNGTVGLRDINLTIKEGELVVIVGLSGAGKSTFLRSINRLNEISSGEIRVGGQSVTRAAGRQLRLIRRDIGMVFQNFNLIKRQNVLSNVLSGRVGYHSTLRTMLGWFPKPDVAIALEALNRVNILEKAYVRADQLSGGQQQRVSIARALAQEARVILADEPVASLDPLTTRQVMDDLKRINREMNITTVINLHFIDLAREYATRIIGLRAGEVVFDGTPEEATDEALAEIYGRPVLKDELLGGVS
ncbi:phosphonate ABC transporter ATP-binding protein [Paenibacillus cellulositrophicus]|uniref:phosphonate ABC transporter ATP-binding protein n=1 Tax=Paenibacillus cellulositrophicus TaxID=562959 RepID=UPI001267597E|nr:phosphonate ABC transporter ATP-binding protein [Paenibacillus cellulositrophicus]